MLRYKYIAIVFIFASIMNAILPQHLHASIFCTCRNVHICIWLQSLFGQINKPVLKIVLHI